jgi:hypothetical protein
VSGVGRGEPFDGVARLVHDGERGVCLRYVSGPECDRAQLIATAGREQVLLAVLRRLRESGIDLDALAIPAETYAALPSAKVLPAPGRSAVSLRALHDRLARHADLVHELATELAARLPYSWVAAYGAALLFGYPGYRDRVCNDLDLFAKDEDRARALVHVLSVDLGFSLVHEHRSEVRGTRVAYRKLRREVESGHVLWVDLFTTGRAAAGLLRAPVVYPPLFERARRVEASRGGVLIPAAEDMLLLLAEKVLRRGAFRLRSTLDARAILLAESALDWDAVRAGSRRLGVTPGLAWLLDTAERSAGRPLVPPEGRRAMRLPPWERLLLAFVPRGGRRPMGWYRRARALQLHLWVARYAAGTGAPVAAWRSLHAERVRRRRLIPRGAPRLSAYCPQCVQTSQPSWRQTETGPVPLC